MTAIETTFNGIRYRSRLEARWAVFFTTAGIPFEYEKQGYIRDGTPYLPDFWMPDQGIWVEIKGAAPTADERHKADLLLTETGAPVFVCYGDIPDPPRFPNSSAALHLLGMDGLPMTDDGYHWCECDLCGFIDMTFGGRTHIMRHTRECQGTEREYGDDTPKLLRAYTAARGARFERGEAPLTAMLRDITERKPAPTTDSHSSMSDSRSESTRMAGTPAKGDAMSTKKKAKKAGRGKVKAKAQTIQTDPCWGWLFNGHGGSGPFLTYLCGFGERYLAANSENTALGQRAPWMVNHGGIPVRATLVEGVIGVDFKVVPTRKARP